MLPSRAFYILEVAVTAQDAFVEESITKVQFLKLAEFACDMRRIPIKAQPAAPVDNGFDKMAIAQGDGQARGIADPPLHREGLKFAMEVEADRGLEAIAKHVDGKVKTEEAEKRGRNLVHGRNYIEKRGCRKFFFVFYRGGERLGKLPTPGSPGLGISPRRGQLPTSRVLAHIVVGQVGLFVAQPAARRALGRPIAAPHLRPWILLIGGFVFPLDGGTTLRTVAIFFHVFVCVVFR